MSHALCVGMHDLRMRCATDIMCVYETHANVARRGVVRISKSKRSGEHVQEFACIYINIYI